MHPQEVSPPPPAVTLASATVDAVLIDQLRSTNARLEAALKVTTRTLTEMRDEHEEEAGRLSDEVTRLREWSNECMSDATRHLNRLSVVAAAVRPILLDYLQRLELFSDEGLTPVGRERRKNAAEVLALLEAFK